MTKDGLKPRLKKFSCSSLQSSGTTGRGLARAVLVINTQYGNYRATSCGRPSGRMCAYMHVHTYMVSILNKMRGKIRAHVCEHDNMCEHEQNMFSNH